MTLEALKLLEDMREAANDVASFTGGKSVDDYRADKQLRRAVERSFEIIGEALSQLRKLDPTSAGRISESRKVIAFRNVLIHGYGAIDDGKTWDIVNGTCPYSGRNWRNSWVHRDPLICHIHTSPLPPCNNCSPPGEPAAAVTLIRLERPAERERERPGD